MVGKIFSWLAGLALVMVFLVVVSPDIFRGYVFSREDRSSGERVYETYCVGCHGVDGLGNGPASEFLNPKPRNFVNGPYKFFHFSEPGPFPSDASLEITIRNGLPGSSMPAFPLITDQELSDVIGYMKSFREGGWVAPQPIQAAPEPVMVEGETAEDIFASAGCTGCHQLDAVGATGGVGPSLNDVGARLSKDELVQSIMEPNVVIAENCPAGPCPEGVMPEYYGDRLTPEQVDTLANFLAEQQ
jgi:mono/diheme cytochrome c family protein